jgi:hypothetical protein
LVVASSSPYASLKSIIAEAVRNPVPNVLPPTAR